MKIARLTIEMTTEELLNSSWYSDGSGATYGGLPTLDPDNFEINAVDVIDGLPEQAVSIELVLKDDV